jgi:trigger factor
MTDKPTSRVNPTHTATEPAEAVHTHEVHAAPEEGMHVGHGHAHAHAATPNIVDLVGGEEDHFEFVEEPEYDIQYHGDCAYEIKVRIPEGNAKNRMQFLVTRLQSEVELPGFRKGKAPTWLVERKFAKNLRHDVVDTLLRASLEKLEKEKKLVPVGQPDIDGLETLPEAITQGPLEFTLRFEVMPKVEMEKYRGLTIERPVVQITDAEVDEAIERIRHDFATLEPVASGESVKEGDQVIIDFTATMDGAPLEGGSAEGYPYVVGSKRFFEEFETALQGAKAGEQRTCSVTFPETYSRKEWRGKTAEFTITVREIKREALPVVNDDFAKKLGHDNVEALREFVRQQLIEHTEAEVRRLLERRALDAILASSTFEIPKKLAQQLTENQIEEEIRKLRKMRYPEDKIVEERETLRQKAEEAIIRELKEAAVLREIADAEGFEVTEEDMEKEAEGLSHRLSVGIDAVRAYLQSDEARSRYGSRILYRKAMDVILNTAEYKDVPTTREELSKALADVSERG